jgi:DNA-binding FrmR family transcriptional regulator
MAIETQGPHPMHDNAKQPTKPISCLEESSINVIEDVSLLKGQMSSKPCTSNHIIIRKQTKRKWLRRNSVVIHDPVTIRTISDIAFRGLVASPEERRYCESVTTQLEKALRLGNDLLEDHSNDHRKNDDDDDERFPKRLRMLDDGSKVQAYRPRPTHPIHH